MALQKTIETEHGVTVDDAYIRIERLFVHVKDEVSFKLRFYASPSKPFIKEQNMSAPYTLLGENPFKQAYDYLKGLPEFNGARDV